jgi:hypothetical protein
MTEEQMFPYDMFPVRLEHKDGKTKKVCHFQCVEHLEKYVTRHHLTPKECKVAVKNGVYKPKKVKTPKRKPKGKLFSSIDEFFV